MSAIFEAGLIVTAIGMGVVFMLLTLMVGVIRGMSLLSAAIEGPAAPAAAGAGTAAAAPEDSELTAVIGAAIQAHRRRHGQ